MNLKIKDVVRCTRGNLIIGNEENECENFSRDTRTVKKGDTYMRFTCYDYIVNDELDRINVVDMSEYDLVYDIKTVADVYSNLESLRFADAVAIQKKLEEHDLEMAELNDYIVRKAMAIHEEYKAVQAWKEEISRVDLGI